VRRPDGHAADPGRHGRPARLEDHGVLGDV
jgi:hypothetical protein